MHFHLPAFFKKLQCNRGEWTPQPNEDKPVKTRCRRTRKAVDKDALDQCPTVKDTDTERNRGEPEKTDEKKTTISNAKTWISHIPEKITPVTKRASEVVSKIKRSFSEPPSIGRKKSNVDTASKDEHMLKKKYRALVKDLENEREKLRQSKVNVFKGSSLFRAKHDVSDESITESSVVEKGEIEDNDPSLKNIIDTQLLASKLEKDVVPAPMDKIYDQIEKYKRKLKKKKHAKTRNDLSDQSDQSETTTTESSVLSENKKEKSESANSGIRLPIDQLDKSKRIAKMDKIRDIKKRKKKGKHVESKNLPVSQSESSETTTQESLVLQEKGVDFMKSKFPKSAKSGIKSDQIKNVKDKKQAVEIIVQDKTNKESKKHIKENNVLQILSDASDTTTSEGTMPVVQEADLDDSKINKPVRVGIRTNQPNKNEIPQIKEKINKFNATDKNDLKKGIKSPAIDAFTTQSDTSETSTSESTITHVQETDEFTLEAPNTETMGIPTIVPNIDASVPRVDQIDHSVAEGKLRITSPDSTAVIKESTDDVVEGIMALQEIEPNRSIESSESSSTTQQASEQEVLSSGDSDRLASESTAPSPALAPAVIDVTTTQPPVCEKSKLGDLNMLPTDQLHLVTTNHKPTGSVEASDIYPLRKSKEMQTTEQEMFESPKLTRSLEFVGDGTSFCASWAENEKMIGDTKVSSQGAVLVKFNGTPSDHEQIASLKTKDIGALDPSLMLKGKAALEINVCQQTHLNVHHAKRSSSAVGVSTTDKRKHSKRNKRHSARVILSILKELKRDNKTEKRTLKQKTGTQAKPSKFRPILKRGHRTVSTSTESHSDSLNIENPSHTEARSYRKMGQQCNRRQFHHHERGHHCCRRSIIANRPSQALQHACMCRKSMICHNVNDDCCPSTALICEPVHTSDPLCLGTKVTLNRITDLVAWDLANALVEQMSFKGTQTSSPSGENCDDHLQGLAIMKAMMSCLPKGNR